MNRRYCFFTDPLAGRVAFWSAKAETLRYNLTIDVLEEWLCHDR
ncbi:hypothetical protein ACN4EG_13885 [Alkalinema pantanalense CENA528]